MTSDDTALSIESPGSSSCCSHQPLLFTLFSLSGCSCRGPSGGMIWRREVVSTYVDLVETNPST